MNCQFQINDEWSISGEFGADVIPRIGENLALYGLKPDERGSDVPHYLIGVWIEEVNYDLPPRRFEAQDITVDLYSATPTIGGRVRMRDLARDLIAEGWEVWDDASAVKVTDPESARDVELTFGTSVNR